MAELGAEMRQKFSFLPDCVPICHGSYGAVPTSILDKRISLLREVARSPDHYYRRTLYPRWQHNLQRVCEFLKLSYANTVFVDNVTNGMNCALRCVDWKAGDRILVNSSTYPAVYQTCRYITNTRDVEIVCIDLTPPILSKEDMISRYERVIQEHAPFKLAIIDAISSPTATRFPLFDLVKLFRSHDIMVAVDAAHAPGQLEVDVEKLQPDFYSGNLHKWLYVPQTAAILWVNPKHHERIVPGTVSTFYKQNLHQMFYWQGTSDYTQFLCVADAIDFYHSIGGLPTITKYNSSLLDEAVHYLTTLWDTAPYGIPVEMQAPNLRGVVLPKIPKYPLPDVPEGSVFTDQTQLMIDLYESHKIMTMILVLHGHSVVRLSANIYNTMEDFRVLGQAILDLKDQPADQTS